MAIFGKKNDDEIDLDKEEIFIDDNFREELRNHGRWYFDKVLTENGKMFKSDLDETITYVKTGLEERINSKLDEAVAAVATELKQTVIHQLEEQFANFTTEMRQSQDALRQSLMDGAKDVNGQQMALFQEVKSSIADQQNLLKTTTDESRDRARALQEAQGEALAAVQSSIQALEKQHQELEQSLRDDVAKQKAVLVEVFENNMTRIIEKYLLDALEDQYDLKSQVPAIIKKMEANRQAIVDDIEL